MGVPIHEIDPEEEKREEGIYEETVESPSPFESIETEMIDGEVEESKLQLELETESPSKEADIVGIHAVQEANFIKNVVVASVGEFARTNFGGREQGMKRFVQLLLSCAALLDKGEISKVRKKFMKIKFVVLQSKYGVLWPLCLYNPGRLDERVDLDRSLTQLHDDLLHAATYDLKMAPYFLHWASENHPTLLEDMASAGANQDGPGKAPSDGQRVETWRTKLFFSRKNREFLDAIAEYQQTWGSDSSGNFSGFDESEMERIIERNPVGFWLHGTVWKRNPAPPKTKTQEEKDATYVHEFMGKVHLFAETYFDERPDAKRKFYELCSVCFRHAEDKEFLKLKKEYEKIQRLTRKIHIGQFGMPIFRGPEWLGHNRDEVEEDSKKLLKVFIDAERLKEIRLNSNLFGIIQTEIASEIASIVNQAHAAG